jgi:PAS domain-containing protein
VNDGSEGRAAGRGTAHDATATARDGWLARSVLDSAHEAFISMDANGLITDWNLEAERTFGFSRAEAAPG